MTNTKIGISEIFSGFSMLAFYMPPTINVHTFTHLLFSVEKKIKCHHWKTVETNAYNINSNPKHCLFDTNTFNTRYEHPRTALPVYLAFDRSTSDDDDGNCEDVSINVCCT